MRLKYKGYDVDWIHLAQGRDQRRTFHVNMVMHFRVPYEADDILTLLQCECECARACVSTLRTRILII
jgi:hypothetical protein